MVLVKPTRRSENASPHGAQSGTAAHGRASLAARPAAPAIEVSGASSRNRCTPDRIRDAAV